MASLLGRGVFALLAPHALAWGTQDGYVIQSEGGDIADLPAEEIDVHLAREKCDQHDECEAISLPKSSKSSKNPKVYYKNSAEHIYNDCWKSFSKSGKYEEATDGFLPQDGDDLGTQDSFEAATTACDQNQKCKGFSARGDEQVFYLKKKWSTPHHDCWETHVKHAEEDGGEDGEEASYGGGEEAGEEAAASYYGAEEAPAEEEAEAPPYGGAAEEPAPAYGGGAAEEPAYGGGAAEEAAPPEEESAGSPATYYR